MNVQSKSDAMLEADLKTLRQTERAITVEVLQHILEIESRDIHLAQRFSSINQYCIEVLNYSEDEAYLRIKAMRLLKILPQVEDQLLDGSVTLTNLFLMQAAFTRENKRRHQEKQPALSLDEKAQLLELLKHQSASKCRRVLAEVFPDSTVHLEKMRPLSKEMWLLECAIPNDLKESIDRLHELRAHANFERKFVKLLADLVEVGLDKFDPVRRSERRARRADAHEKKKPAQAPREKRQDKTSARGWQEDEAVSQPPPADAGDNSPFEDDGAHTDRRPLKLNLDEFFPPNPCRTNSTSSLDIRDFEVASIDVSKRRLRRPYFSLIDRDTIFVESDGQCTFVDKRTGQRCANRHAMQFDHRIPFANGGATNCENMRLLCFAHNQFESRKIFGRRSTVREVAERYAS